MNHTVSKNFEHVEIGNLILRMPTLEDTDAVFAIHGDPVTNQHNPAGPITSQKEAVEKIESWKRDWSVNGFGYWSVVDRTQAEVIGICGIRLHKLGDRDTLNLYYRFSPKSWGHGYATTVARVAVEMAGVHLRELPVIARIRSTNTPSIRVAEKVGLVHCPRLDTDDHMVFIKE